MPETTQEMIAEVRELTQRIELNPLVEKAYVNDWGRYGNFDVHIIPKLPDRYTTKRLQGVVCQEIKASAAKVRDIFAPDAVYDTIYDYDCQRYVKRAVGYRRSHWAVDIDYFTFNKGGNTFS